MTHDGLDDDIAETLVILRRCRVRVMRCRCKVLAVPECAASLLEVGACMVLKAYDVVFVASLVHVGMDDELSGILFGGIVVRTAGRADPTFATPGALNAADMTMAYQVPRVRANVRHLRRASVREVVAVSCPDCRSDNKFRQSLGLRLVLSGFEGASALIQILDQASDCIRLVLWEIDRAFLRGLDMISFAYCQLSRVITVVVGNLSGRLKNPERVQTTALCT